MEPSKESFTALVDAAASFMRGNPGLDPKTAIRRAARTSDWKHDPERLAAADAKRARKMARRVK
jgi:hypothetical protein